MTGGAKVSTLASELAVSYKDNPGGYWSAGGSRSYTSPSSSSNNYGTASGVGDESSSPESHRPRCAQSRFARYGYSSVSGHTAGSGSVLLSRGRLMA